MQLLRVLRMLCSVGRCCAHGSGCEGRHSLVMVMVTHPLLMQALLAATLQPALAIMVLLALRLHVAAILLLQVPGAA
jgi:hypothetical protein